LRFDGCRETAAVGYVFEKSRLSQVAATIVVFYDHSRKSIAAKPACAEIRLRCAGNLTHLSERGVAPQLLCRFHLEGARRPCRALIEPLAIRLRSSSAGMTRKD
jgi:hypothetical protein